MWLYRQISYQLSSIQDLFLSFFSYIFTLENWKNFFKKTFSIDPEGEKNFLIIFFQRKNLKIQHLDSWEERRNQGLNSKNFQFINMKLLKKGFRSSQNFILAFFSANLDSKNFLLKNISNSETHISYCIMKKISHVFFRKLRMLIFRKTIFLSQLLKFWLLYWTQEKKIASG